MIFWDASLRFLNVNQYKVVYNDQLCAVCICYYLTKICKKMSPSSTKGALLYKFVV